MEQVVAFLAHLGYWVAAVLATLLAAGAAGHAIIYKRDSRSAVSWVGLIILAPVVGPVLYALLGVNRVRRRAAEVRRAATRLTGDFLVQRSADRVLVALLPDSPHLLTLGRYVDRITRRSITAGNAVRPLVDGDAAYPAMLSAIDGARDSVALETYIFDNDAAGLRFVEALARAVQRGVQVRVLVDAVGARYSRPSIIHLLREHRVPVARFMPTRRPWSAPFWNLRSHRKILVVDGRIGFAGGINIRAGHVLGERPRSPVRDLHFQFEGPVLQHLSETFVEDWAFTTGEVLEGSPWFRNVEPAGPVVARGIMDGPDHDFLQLHQVMLGAIACAQGSIRVLTPYFVPDGTLVTALTVAATRGVTVEIVLPARSNLRFVDWATQAMLWQVLKRDCRVFYTPPPFDHSKLMLVDDRWALVGSSNWDARSLRLNFEFNVECYDAALASELGTLFAARRDAGREVLAEELDARPLPIQLRDGIARLATPYL